MKHYLLHGVSLFFNSIAYLIYEVPNVLSVPYTYANKPMFRSETTK